MFLGLDVGRSGTQFALVDEEGKTVRAGSFGYRVGADPFLLQAFVNSFDPQRVCVASAGVWTAEERKAFRRALGVEALVLSDAEAALWGAFGGREGAVVVAGTGSVALAWDGKTLFRAGGFGPSLGDPGSGHWLGSRGFLAGRASAEGWGGPTRLEELRLPRGAGVKQVADLAKKVLELAEAGDPEALSIAREGARSLARMAKALSERIGAPRVSWAGGLFKNRFYLNLFLEEVGALGLRPEPPARSPAEGAALIALMGRCPFRPEAP